MKKFEYKTCECILTDATLNSFGDEGWELVTHSISVIADSTAPYYIFKREKNEE